MTPTVDIAMPAPGTPPQQLRVTADAGFDPLALAPLCATTEARWRAAAATSPTADGAIVDGPLGYLPMGDAMCDLVGIQGSWAWDGGCRVRYPAQIDLFPWRASGVTTYLVVVEIPEPPPGAASAELTSSPASSLRTAAPIVAPWLFALAFMAGAVPLAGGIGYLVGRRANQAPPAAPPPPPPPPPGPPADAAAGAAGATSADPAASPASRSIPPKPDPYMLKQVALFDYPHVRRATEFLARADWIERHRKASALLLSISDELLRKGAHLPPAYLAAWKALADEVRIREEPVARVAKSLRHVLADPKLVASMPFETRVAWRALLPYTDVTVADDGRSLAGQLFADVARALVSPYTALGQFVTEALPRETDLPRVDLDVREHAVEFADALGFRYEHVELYHRTDADFMLDREVTVTGVGPDDVWFGLTPVWPDAGTIVRVARPCLRGRDGLRTLRGHVMAFRDPNATPPGAPS